MSYIYHLRPEPFEGTSLIPLNSMDKESDLYKGHAKKYTGREDLMDGTIPILNCKWNDVVQFSALDPQIIVNELIKHKENLKLIRLYYFKVHVKDIVSKYDAVVFDRKVSRGKGDFRIDESEVQYLSENSYQELSQVPQETIEYWKSVKADGGKFLWFPFVTHIMVKGIINIKGFELCELKL
ncbi:MAG: hypothetical protein HON90_03155 [Halobacteriovoraceae bacterium]|jgi:hypothetical protein|nr:hypothetical protein [Halobacteriovoraceae bacterium]